MKKLRLNFHLFIILAVIFIVIVFLSIGSMFYFISTGHDGKLVWNDWPISFTEDFSKQIVFKDGAPSIKQEGYNELIKYNLWLQIINKKGDEVLVCNKPSEVLSHYSPMDILQLNMSSENRNYTIFAKGIENDGEKWTCIIGFPLKISKVTMYLNYDKFHNGKSILIIFMIIIILIIFIACMIYSVWVTKHMSNIMESIKKISLRTYESTTDKGFFGNVYDSLNLLDHELKTSYEERKRNDNLREEWIANITHDIKTPLSPIKGYAELITDTGYAASPEELVRYGEIILKNAGYAEELVNDLKITYQLKNGMLPINKKEYNIVSFLKEIIIDILNNPEYEARKISFNYEPTIINFNFDSILLKRAFNNLLYNAVIHNTKETEITVLVEDANEELCISIKDNGKGMVEDDLKNLFQRYYRGTNTDGNTNGTGLGMAIAKQIIEAHGGSISAYSKSQIGTSILVKFPIQN